MAAQPVAVVLSATDPQALPVLARPVSARKPNGGRPALPNRLEVPRTPAVPVLSSPASVEGGHRLLWHSRFGPVLIEVIDGVCFVNHERVEPAPSASKE